VTYNWVLGRPFGSDIELCFKLPRTKNTDSMVGLDAASRGAFMTLMTV
jgi:hypothetical protein